MAEESKTGEHGRPEAVKMAKNGGGKFSQRFSVMFETFAEILVMFEIFAEIFSDV